MRKRNQIIVLYLSDQEKLEYEKLLELSGLTKQAYGLKALLGKEIMPRPCDHHPALLKSLSAISNDIGEILRTLHVNGQLTEGECGVLFRRLNDCWKEIHDNTNSHNKSSIHENS